MRLRRLGMAGRKETVGLWLLFSLLVGSCGGSSQTTAVGSSPVAPERGETGSEADRTAASQALAGRTIVGYQAWFGCPGERQLGAPDTAGGKTTVGGSAARWRHWFAAQVDDASSLTVDMLPDVSTLPESARCATGLRRSDGSVVSVFSSADPAVIDRHFEWMQTHGIDGAAVQRFVSDLHPGADRERSDAILRAIRGAAEAHGRVFYISYDISGADPATVYDDIRADWRRLTGELALTASSAYLSGHGMPLLQIWGFGFRDRPGDPGQVRALMADLRRGSTPGVLLIGGIPSGWRNANGDSRTGAEWATLYRSFDVISPWSVGRYSDEASNLGYVQGLVIPDLEETTRLGIGYLPVVYPGFSWANLMKSRGNGNTAQAAQNRVPRRCGDFLWQQGQTRLAAGARSLFIAMFDEVDEATAVMPVVARTEELPPGTGLIALDHDGCKLPSDWYLRISGSLAGYLKAGEVPPAVLSTVLRP
ncbi:MAG: glycoside hydrolase family 71/99-like protein [Lautropia sp.]